MTLTTVLILLSVLCSSVAHMLLKIGAVRLTFEQVSTYTMASTVFNPYILSGGALHVFALALWVLALRNAELSYAYPFIALGFVLVMLFSGILLEEQISPLRIIGALLIVGGVMCVART